MQKSVRQAMQEDLEKIQTFLAKTAVDTEDIEKWLNYYLLVEDRNGDLIGTIGIEPFEKVGLLRSLVIANATAEDILYLLQQTIQLAKERQLESLYCMINNKSAIHLFSLLGFRTIRKEKMPEEIKTSKSVANIWTVNNLQYMYYHIENVNK